MTFSHKKKSLLFFTLGYFFLAVALFCTLSSLISIGMQRNAKNHPIKLLEEKSAISQFFLKMPSLKQKGYLILGLTTGLITGICFGAGYDYAQRSKNQK